MLTRYKLYVGSNRYKLKSPSFIGKGSFVKGLAVSLSEVVSAHVNVTCFDGGDGSVTVVASGGTPPYQYSTDPTFATYNSTGVFDNLAITGPVTEGTDQYGGILICTKIIYVRDANNHIASLDVQLKSPVELDYILPDNIIHYATAEEIANGYAVVPLPFIPYVTTTANNCDTVPTPIPQDNKYHISSLSDTTTYNMLYMCWNDCNEEVQKSFTITIIKPS